MSSEKKIRFGIIGTNNISDKIVAASRFDKRFVLNAVYSRTQETADAFAAKHNIPNTFISVEEMAQSNLIDAVYIASPNSFHAGQSIVFMQNGKHVLCEKPMASNIGEVREMIDASRKYDVTLMEAMMPTLKPGFKSVMKHLGEIGIVRRYFACYCQYSSRYDQLKEGIILNAFKPELSNGAVVDIGIYTIYPMVVLFGRPSKIDASGLLLSTGVDGQGSVNFTYNNMNATVIYSKIADSYLQTEIQGEQGTIIIDKINNIRNVSLKYRSGEQKDISSQNIIHDYFYEISEFIDLIEAGKRESEINSHENSIITTEIIDEIRRQTGVIFPADK